MDFSFGPRSFLYHLEKENLRRNFQWEDYKLHDAFAEKFSLTKSPEIFDKLSELCRFIFLDYDHEINSCLDKIEKLVGYNSQALKFLFNTEFSFIDDERPLSVFQRLIEYTDCERTFIRFFKIACDPDKSYTHCDQFIPAKKSKHAETELSASSIRHSITENNSLAHLAAFSCKISALSAIRRLNYPLNTANSDGDTPFSIVLKNFDPKAKNTIKLLDFFICLEDPIGKVSTSNHPAALLIMSGNIDYLSRLTNIRVSPPVNIKNQTYIIYSGSETYRTDFNGLLKNCCNLSQEIKQLSSYMQNQISHARVLKDAAVFFSKHYNFYDYYLFLKSFRDLASKEPVKDSSAFVLLSRTVHSKYSPAHLNLIFAAYELRNDRRFYKSRIPADQGPHDAEFLLNLAHPFLLRGIANKSKNIIVRALTSSYRYIDYGPGHIDISDGGWMTLQNWQRIGQLTHGFQRWKYDFKSIEGQSLAEKFGFRRKEKDQFDPRFGSMFLLKPFLSGIRYISDLEPEYLRKYKPASLLIETHAFKAIFDPDHGTLIIRNSSLVFGRNILKHAAYYSPVDGPASGFNHSNLHKISAEDIELLFAPVLAREINGIPLLHYPAEMFPSTWRSLHDQHNEDILILLSQLDGIYDHYKSWKFETREDRVFKNKNNPKVSDLIGAYKSGGFSELVEIINCFYRHLGPDKCPHLALADPYQPPFAYYTYKPYVIENDEQSAELSTLKLDDFSLEVLNELAQGSDDFFYLEASNLRSFFQKALDAEADLILVDPS